MASKSKPLPRSAYRVGRSATGLGLFAVEPIEKGAFIIEYKGPKVTNAVADTLTNKYLFELNSRWTINGAGRRNIARYINHSCRPNAESDIVRGKVKIMARRNIKPDEEIAYDYGKDYFDTFLTKAGCKCVKCVERRREERRAKRLASARKKARAAARAAKASGNASAVEKSSAGKAATRKAAGTASDRTQLKKAVRKSAKTAGKTGLKTASKAAVRGEGIKKGKAAAGSATSRGPSNKKKTGS